MSGELEDLMIEYIRTSAILNHLEQYNGTTDELNEVTGKLTILKLRLLEELNQWSYTVISAINHSKLVGYCFTSDTCSIHERFIVAMTLGRISTIKHLSVHIVGQKWLIGFIWEPVKILEIVKKGEK